MEFLYCMLDGRGNAKKDNGYVLPTIGSYVYDELGVKYVVKKYDLPERYTDDEDIDLVVVCDLVDEDSREVETIIRDLKLKYLTEGDELPF